MFPTKKWSDFWQLVEQTIYLDNLLYDGWSSSGRHRFHGNQITWRHVHCCRWHKTVTRLSWRPSQPYILDINLMPSKMKVICFLEKFNITSLAHQCSEWVPSEWESKQLIKTTQEIHTTLVHQLMSLFLKNTQLSTSQDINWWTGLVWITCGLWCFYQPFGLSFWRQPFTAEDPKVNKRCNPKFLKICSHEETNSPLSWTAFSNKKNKKSFFSISYPYFLLPKRPCMPNLNNESKKKCIFQYNQCIPKVLFTLRWTYAWWQTKVFVSLYGAENQLANISYNHWGAYTSKTVCQALNKRQRIRINWRQKFCKMFRSTSFLF